MSTRTRRAATKKTPTKVEVKETKTEPKVETEAEPVVEKAENGEAEKVAKEEVQDEEELEGEDQEEVDDDVEKELLEGTDDVEGDENDAEEGDEEKVEEEGEGEKAAEGTEEDKKKTEKKTEDKKNKTYTPSAGKFNQDEHVYMRLRSVVVGPLELDDLENEIVKDMVTKAEEFFYRFHFIEKEDKHVGHIEFRFKTIPAADEMIETLKNVKEGVVVKRLVGGMNAAKFDKDVRGINDDSEKEKYKRIVAVGGIPETATVEKLQEVFPGARVKFIALKPDGTPKWYAYLELDDEAAAKKYAEEHKEVEYEGEKLYCRCLRPGKPEEADFEKDPDHVMTDEERKKLQARINTMKYKLNGGAVLRPLDAQRLRRRVSQLTSLLRANQKRKANFAAASGDNAEAAPKTPAKTPTKTGTVQKQQRTMRGGMRGNMRGGRGGQMMRGARQWQGPGPNRNMGSPGFQGNQRMQNMGPMGSPRNQGWGGGRGRSPAMNQGAQQAQGQNQGQSNMYNNPRKTANAVNMLVGLTNLLSQARNQGGSQRGGNQGGNQGGNFRGNQGGNQGGNFRGNNFDDGSNYNDGGNFNNNFGAGGGGGRNYDNQGGYNQGGNFGGNQGGNFGGNQGGNFGGSFGGGNQGGNLGGGFNRKRQFSGNRRGGPPNKQGRRFGNNWN